VKNRSDVVLSAVLSATLVLAACETAYNPLEDYKQLNPATDMPVPTPVDNPNFTAEQVARG
jgi:uncharacterized lipoprotein YmbA